MPFLAARKAAGHAGRVAPIGAAYGLCAAATLLLTRFNGGLAIVWLAGAVLFAKLVASPRRQWCAVTLAGLAAGIPAALLFGYGHGIALPLACIATGEAFGAAWAVKRLCPRFGRFQSAGEAVWFLAVAGVLAPGLGASLAAACARAAGGMAYGAAWRDWFAGHALGMVVFAPPLLLVLRGEARRWIGSARRPRLGEAAALLGAVAAACVAAFGQARVPLVILPLVPMIAATFRLGRLGAGASTVILTAIGLACSLAGLGPTTLLSGTMATKIQIVQFYFATVALILLPIAADLRARHRLLDRLRAAEALHRLILDRTGDVVLRTAADGTIRYASPFVAKAWGHSPEALTGTAELAFVCAEDRPAVREAHRRALADPDETVGVTHRVVRADGAIIWVESHIRAAFAEDGGGTGTVGIVREITAHRRVVEDLARAAATDPLTGLANRRTFDEALAARAGEGVDGGGCVALFDLDHFKRVNDAHGHATGDAVLVRFAAVLRAAVRDGDLVARIGGEEFAVLLQGATLEQARRVCDRIRIRLAAGEERSPAGEAVRVTVSVGVAPLAGGAGEPVLAAADRALYRAKEAGRNQLALAA